MMLLNFILGAAKILIGVPLSNWVKKLFGNDEMARKTIHILSYQSLFIFNYMVFKDTIYFILYPIAYCIISPILIRLGLIACIRRDEGKQNEMSCLYGGIAFTILAVLAYYYEPFYLYFGLGACALAFGDSSAALLGKKFGKYTPRLPFNKSLAGTLAFITFTTLSMYIPILMIGTSVPLYILIILAFIGSIVEIFAGDFDNFLIPMVVTLSANIIV